MTPPDADPLVDDIRAIRSRVWDECGRDMEALLRRLQAVQERHGDRLLPPPPGEPADHRAA